MRGMIADCYQTFGNFLLTLGSVTRFLLHVHYLKAKYDNYLPQEEVNNSHATNANQSCWLQEWKLIYVVHSA